MNADGSGAHIIQDVQTSYSAYPAWSPDGTKILFASPRDGAFTDIYVMNADGSAVVRLTHSPAEPAEEPEGPTATLCILQRTLCGVKTIP